MGLGDVVRNLRRRVQASAAAVALVGLSVVALPTTSAQATGTGAWLCAADAPWMGGSSNSGTSKGAYTQEDSSAPCNNVAVAYAYYTYSGSPLYWTSYTYGGTYVFQKGSNIVSFGGHKVTWCVTIVQQYTCGPKYA